jgi:hypothetical protein
MTGEQNGAQTAPLKRALEYSSRGREVEVCGTHWQCHRLYAGIVRIVGNVKAELGAHGKHGGIFR